MNQYMEYMCTKNHVDFNHLLNKVEDGLKGYSIEPFSYEELEIILAALELASE